MVDPSLLRSLGLSPFRERWPWRGPDLQTVRDTVRTAPLPPDRSRSLLIEVGGGDALLARLDLPAGCSSIQAASGPRGGRALVLVLPGLGGCSSSQGPRRLALALQRAGFATLRLNLRGAGEGRTLAGGSYAARCDSDLLPMLRRARRLAAELGGGSALPLAAVGISLGGTMLLNALHQAPRAVESPWLDALICLSSPLDLPACTLQFERPRNALYQRWLVSRLCQQVLADRRGLTPRERAALTGEARPRTIRGFDEAITAPRWGYPSAERYYTAASPLPALRHWLEARPGVSAAPSASAACHPPPTLLLHAADDPWVPAGPALELVRRLALARQDTAGTGAVRPGFVADLVVLVTDRGGHCGFHAVGDDSLASWSDRLCAAWLERHFREGREGRLMVHAQAAPPPRG